MPVDTQRVWLSEHACNRMKIELAALLVQRARGEAAEDRSNPDDGQGHDAQDDHAIMVGWERRELRIRQLQELIRSAVVHEPPDDGVAEPGMVLTVRYDQEGVTDTFLMAEREGADYGALEICSPHSPLGMALVGATPGEEREYVIPGGATMTATLVKAVPYRCR